MQQAVLIYIINPWIMTWAEKHRGANLSEMLLDMNINIKFTDVVEADCYFVDIRRTDSEQLRSRININ